jgi:hypothetical protein
MGSLRILLGLSCRPANGAPQRQEKLDSNQVDQEGQKATLPRRSKQGGVMANPTERALEEEVPEEPVPAMQHLLDNPFLLLFIGIAMPTVLYIVWGVMEIVSLPIAK